MGFILSSSYFRCYMSTTLIADTGLIKFLQVFIHYDESIKVLTYALYSRTRVGRTWVPRNHVFLKHILFSLPNASLFLV